MSVQHIPIVVKQLNTSRNKLERKKIVFWGEAPSRVYRIDPIEWQANNYDVMSEN